MPDPMTTQPYVSETRQQNYLNDILSKCLHEILSTTGWGMIEAVILTGSVGRDEGSIISDQGFPRLLNDIDFLVVSNKYSDKAAYLCAAKIKHTHGLDFVDIGHTNPKKLKGLKPTVATFDLKHGSKVIHGNKNIQASIPTIEPNQIGLEEAARLILNRLAGLLIAETRNTNTETLAVQLSKLLIALGDYHVISNGKYVSSYKRRREIIKDLIEPGQNKELILLGYDFKIEPSQIKSNSLLKLRPSIKHTLNLFLNNQLHALLSNLPGTPTPPLNTTKLVKLIFASLSARSFLLSQKQVYRAILRSAISDKPAQNLRAILASWEIVCH